MKRTDTHRPSAIVPSEYDYVGQEYIPVHGIGDCYALQAMRERIASHMRMTGGTYSPHAHGGNCMVCGSVNAIYTVIFHHRPTNTYVRMGQDCAEKCGMGGDFKDSAFRRAIEDARQAHAGKRKAEAVLADEGLQSAWDVFNTDLPADAYTDDGYGNQITTFKYKEEITVKDIVGKLVKYGSISPGQVRYLHVLLDKIQNRAIRQAEFEARKKAEALTAADCPSGRVDVEGVILSMKEVESDFGTVTKVLVKADSGYRVWGTLPRMYDTDATGRAVEVFPAKGDRVSFRATVTPKQEDVKFGFYSRPTGGRLIRDSKSELVGVAS